MKKIMTGNYENCKVGNLISISGDRGKRALYDGVCMSNLSPKMSFWGKWHSNIGKISEEENTKYYIREYYKEVLSKIDPEELYNELIDNSILLCYEDNNEFCHRHLVAFYLELFLGIKTYEVRVNPKRETYHVLSRPEYLKSMLEDVIKESYDMNGFDTLKDAYLYNKEKNNKLVLAMN